MAKPARGLVFLFYEGSHRRRCYFDIRGISQTRNNGSFTNLSMGFAKEYRDRGGDRYLNKSTDLQKMHYSRFGNEELELFTKRSQK